MRRRPCGKLHGRAVAVVRTEAVIDPIARYSSRIAIFTALRICIARTMPWQDVCLSVCPSVGLFVCHTPVLCVKGYAYTRFFSLSVAPPF